MTTKTSTETRMWFYAGRRLATGNKIVHAWYDATDDVTRLFNKPLAAGARPGQRFEVEYEAKGDTGTVHGTPVFVAGADDAPEDKIDEWRVSDRTASVIQESQRAAKRDDSDELERALEVLRRHYHAARTWPAQSAFIGYVTHEMTMPPAKRSSR